MQFEEIEQEPEQDSNMAEMQNYQTVNLKQL